MHKEDMELILKSRGSGFGGPNGRKLMAKNISNRSYNHMDRDRRENYSKDQNSSKDASLDENTEEDESNRSVEHSRDASKENLIPARAREDSFSMRK